MLLSLSIFSATVATLALGLSLRGVMSRSAYHRGYLAGRKDERVTQLIDRVSNR